MTTMQVAFVNTEQPPIEVIHHRIWRHIHYGTHLTDDDIGAMELVTKVYPHPDAPDEAKIYLLTWDHPIEIPKEGAAHNLLDVEEHLLVGLNAAMAVYQNP